MSVLADGQRSGIDVSLPAAASLTGVVVAGGEPAAGVSVAAVTPAPEVAHAVAVTGPDGRFQLGGLSPTGYLLTLLPADGDSVVVGAEPDDPDSGIVYPLAAGGTLEAGTIDLGTGGAAPVIVTVALPEAHVGVPVLAPLEAVGGAGGYTWQATGLPAGLTLDTTTGEITGVPTQTASSSVAVVVTDARGASANATLALAVEEGLPEGCVTSDCQLVDLADNAVELPNDAVTSALRAPDGTLTSLALSPSAPPASVGQILLVSPGPHTPDGVVVEVTGVEDGGDGSQTVTVLRAGLADAYDYLAVKSTEATGIPLAEPGAQDLGQHQSESGASAAALPLCIVAPQVQISPDVGFDADPGVLVGKNSGLFGLPYFQFDLETVLTVDLSGRITGRVECDLPGPGVAAGLPLPVGFLSLRLEPSLTLKASAGIDLDTTITLRCKLQYHWSVGVPHATQSCNPSATTPVASGGGADLEVGGEITLTGTYSESVGIEGGIDTVLHTRYRPLERPRGRLDARVGADVIACLGCFLGLNYGEVTLWDSTFYERTFATWGYDPIPVCSDLANSRWEGSYGYNEPFGEWRAEFGPTGSLESFTLSAIGDPVSGRLENVAIDCETIRFRWDNIADWTGSFNTQRTQVTGSFTLVDVPTATGWWSGNRV